MAIAEMHKIRVVTHKQYADFLYSVLQSIQVVEPKEVSVPEHLKEASEEELQDLLAKDEELARLQTIESNLDNSIRFLEQHVPKKSFKERYGVPTPVYTLEELDTEVEKHDIRGLADELHVIRDRLVHVDNSLDGQAEKEDFLLRWRKLRLTEQDIKDFKYVGVIAGTVPQTADNEYVNRLHDYEQLVVEEVLHTEDLFGFVGYYNVEDEEEVAETLRDLRFDKLHYPYDKIPNEELEVVKEEVAELKAERQDILDDLKTRQGDLDTLKLAFEYYYAAEQRRRASHLALDTENLHAFEGWIEKERTDEMEAFIYENIPQDKVLVEYEEVFEEEIDDVPIKLKNNALNEPFETVTKMYALPKYDEIDPTPWVTPFYMLFFAMMLADLGYGLLLWLGTFIMLRYINLKPGMRKNIKFFHYLSYPTMIVGLIYGSLFGVTIPTQIIDINNQAVEVLIASMGIGLVHLILGLALNVYVNFKKKDYLSGTKDGLAWIVVLVSAITAALGGIILKSDALLKGSMIAMVIAFVVVIVISTIQDKSKIGGALWGVYDVYGVSGYIGDVVSYSRLMALGMSGGSIAAAFNMLVGMLPIWARFTIGIVLIVGLQLFNMFLSVLSAYVHGLRLVFVEFFGKFYDGGGREFAPLKAKEDYVEIKQKKNYV